MVDPPVFSISDGLHKERKLVMLALQPRRLVSLAITFGILIIPSLVAVLTAAPTCGSSCGM